MGNVRMFYTPGFESVIVCCFRFAPDTRRTTRLPYRDNATKLFLYTARTNDRTLPLHCKKPTYAYLFRHGLEFNKGVFALYAPNLSVSLNSYPYCVTASQYYFGLAQHISRGILMTIIRHGGRMTLLNFENGSTVVTMAKVFRRPRKLSVLKKKKIK